MELFNEGLVALYDELLFNQKLLFENPDFSFDGFFLSNEDLLALLFQQTFIFDDELSDFLLVGLFEELQFSFQKLDSPNVETLLFVQQFLSQGLIL